MDQKVEFTPFPPDFLEKGVQACIICDVTGFYEIGPYRRGKGRTRFPSASPW